MTSRSAPSVSEVLKAGWGRLGEGRWREAQESFGAAVAAEETAEGYEGLSWAAWWLDDGEAVFDARAAPAGVRSWRWSVELRGGRRWRRPRRSRESRRWERR